MRVCAEKKSLKLESMNQTRYFFVTGFPRSGTTALARFLNASGAIACIIKGNVLNRFHQVLSRKQVLNEPHEDLCVDLYITLYQNFFKTIQYHQGTRLMVSPPIFFGPNATSIRRLCT